jgi:ketosteroid isomerase-like protein
MREQNAVIIRQAYEDFAQGNIPAVFAVFDPKITWHVPGHGPLSGDYTGHEQLEISFVGQWSSPEERSAWTYTTCLPTKMLL